MRGATGAWAVVGVMLAGAPIWAIAEGAAPAGPFLPFPEENETFHLVEDFAYPTENGTKHIALESWLRFKPAQDVLHRDGSHRLGIAMEVRQPDVVDEFEDIGWSVAWRQGRWETIVDASTQELLETRLGGVSEVNAAIWVMLLGNISSVQFRSPLLLREFHDPGIVTSGLDLWGRRLPEDSLVLREASMGLPALPSWGRDAIEAARPAHREKSHQEEDTYRFVGHETLDGLPTWHYESADGVVDLWFADGVPVPVRSRIAIPPESGALFSSDTRVEGRSRGTGPLPWGSGHWSPPASVPPLGRLTAWGPEDGDAGLDYPLAEALEAVRGDVTLRAFQAMQQRDPVLVAASYDVTYEADLGGGPPRARWWLAFHDAGGAEVVVTTERPTLVPLPLGLGKAVARNDERASGSHPDFSDVEGIRPDEVPTAMPTIAAALQAAETFSLRRLEGNQTVAYALTRMEDGRVLPLLWAGWSERRTDGVPLLFATVEGRLALVGLDADGRPRYAADVEHHETWRPGALQTTASVGAPARGGSDLPPLADLAAVAVGAAALALLVKLLAPLYSRLDLPGLLRHPVRKALLALVERQPGVALDEAQRVLAIGGGTLAHHVDKLERSGALRVVAAGRYRRLYPAQTAPKSAAQDAALRQPRAAALHRLVASRPGIGLREAARELQVPVSSLQWHAEKLQEAGLMVRRPTGLFVHEP